MDTAVSKPTSCRVRIGTKSNIAPLVRTDSLLQYLLLTSSREPNLSRSKNERTFVDPSSKERQEFPSLEDSATLSLSVIVPSYKEETRCESCASKILQYFKCLYSTNYDGRGIGVLGET